MTRAEKKFPDDTTTFVSIMQKFHNHVVDERRSNAHSSHALLHVHNFLSNILSNSGQFQCSVGVKQPIELEITVLVLSGVAGIVSSP